VTTKKIYDIETETLEMKRLPSDWSWNRESRWLNGATSSGKNRKIFWPR